MKNRRLGLALRCTYIFSSIGLGLGCGSDGQPGVTGPAGSAGPAGPAGLGTPVITEMNPNTGFLGRSPQVQIAAAGTMFQSAMPTVDFGDPGITVSKTTVNSDGNLTLSLAIADTATYGAHDVTIVSGSSTLKLTGAFTVKPELVAEQQSVLASGPQGGLVPIVLRNQDYVQYPFVTTFGQPQLGGAVASPISTGATLTTGRMTATALIDPLAPAGLVAARVNGYDVFGQPVAYYANPTDPNLPTVTARPPTALTVGTTLGSQNFPAPLSSNLYSFSSTVANQIMYVQYSNLGAQIPLINAALAPSSGKFSAGQPLNSQSSFTNQLGQSVLAGLALLPTAGMYYLATYPNNFTGAATGYTHDLVVSTLTGTAFSAKEAATPDTGVLPLTTITDLAAASGAYALDGATDYAGDTDFIRYNVAAANLDVLVQVYAPTATTVTFSLFSDPNCTSPTAMGSGTFVGTAHDLVPNTSQRCIRIQLFGNKYPIPYKVLLAAP